MQDLEDNSIETCITDPPYGLEFMAKEWDHGVPGVPFWEQVLRVLKPGGSLLAFGGTRTHHRLMVAIEDAGFELRDCLMWLYGSGFPKSHDISKAIDKSNPATEDAKTWNGWGTALKPAWEPILLAMKPREGTFAENALEHGVSGLNIDGTRLPIRDDERQLIDNRSGVSDDKRGTIYHRGFGIKEAGEKFISHQQGRWPANLILDEEAAKLLDEQSGNRKAGGELVGTAPSRSGEHETYHLYPDKRIFNSYSDYGGASRFFYVAKAHRSERNAGLDMGDETVNDGRNTPIDNPYQRGETLRQNLHPTIKPLSLMRYLVRLTKTPTGGMVLDPFMGSGSTGMACMIEGRDFIGIEIDKTYLETARQRIEHWEKQNVQLDLFLP
jgi:site-specific DNA-methyltransferase (adenine-specific)